MRESWSHFHANLTERIPQLNPQNDAFRWIVLASVMIGTFMAVLDATVVNVAIPKLMATFGVPVDTVEWILTAYLLIFAVMLPSSGWFADHIGYKKIFITALFLFTLGSFLCSLAWSFDILIFFRVIQGAGAGMLMPVGMAIITREFPPEKRGIALGFWAVSASASVSLGPTVGGYLIDHFSWHTIFDINVPIGIVGIFASAIILREYKSEDSRSFDVVGFVSLATFLTALLLALSNGNSDWNTGGWTSNFILVCFALAFVGLAVFLVAEFTTRHPLIELSLFRDFNFTMSNLVLFIFGLGMFGSNFLLPIYLQNSLGYTPFQAGLVFLPVGIILGIASPIAGFLSDRFSGKYPAILGLALLAFTLYEYSYLSFLSEKSQIMMPLYIRGVAMALIFSPLTTVAISGISNEKMAQASGLINVIRQVGGSFGVAIFGTLLTQRTIYHNQTYGEQLNKYSESFQQTITRLEHFVSQTAGGTVSDSISRAQALLMGFVQKLSFIQAVDDVFLVAAFTLLVSMIPVFFLKNYINKNGRRPTSLE